MTVVGRYDYDYGCGGGVIVDVPDEEAPDSQPLIV